MRVVINAMRAFVRLASMLNAQAARLDALAVTNDAQAACLREQQADADVQADRLNALEGAVLAQRATMREQQAAADARAGRMQTAVDAHADRLRELEATVATL